MENIVNITYNQTGASSNVDELGMREMQRMVYEQRHRQYFRYFFHTFLDKKITQPRSYAIFTYKYNDKKRNNFGLMIAIYQQNF